MSIRIIKSERVVCWLILAASQSDTETSVDKNALLLHCCCVIVQITPVLPGRSNVATVKDTGGGGGRKPVCICNTQCRLEALKQDSYKAAVAKKHGSMDLLPIDSKAADDIKSKATPPPPPHTQIEPQNYPLEKFYHQINGVVFEITRKVPILPADADQHKSHHHGPQQQQQQLTRQRSLTKQQSQPQLRKSDLSDLVNRSDKPQPPLRVSSRQKNVEIEYSVPRKADGSKTAEQLSTEFDRTHRQRHSSRSAGGAERTDSAEWPPERMHQRHSSGPSDISEWLLNLPNKRGADGNKGKDLSKTEVVLSKTLKEELAQLLKRPLQRQHSGGGPSDLKKDIVEWLKSQHAAKVNAPATISKEKVSKTDSHIVPLPKKRHSLGHAELTKTDTPDWIQYPINRLSAAEREKLGVSQSSCADISNKVKSDRSHHHSKQDRRLRHSASEVVTPVSEQGASRHSKKHGSTSVQRDKYQYMYKTSSVSGDHGEKSSRRERSRKSHTQRSATVSDMSDNIYRQPRKSSSAEREKRNSSHPKCTDPMCPLIPICTDPNCCLNECYNTKRCSSLPRCREPHCNMDCYQESPLLPKCVDPKCICRSSNANIIKHNSLPRCVSGSHRTGLHSSLSRGGSRSSLPRLSKSNGRLIKSASAASLNSRRRRHKTVHFGENLLREVCQNRKLIEPLQKTPSEKPSLESNIQMLYNFVEGVLSAWVDEDDVRSGAESEPERGRSLKPLYRCNRLRLQTISRVVTEAAQLRGTLKLGNSRYRHRHWRGTAMECNERFLRKVHSPCNFH